MKWRPLRMRVYQREKNRFLFTLGFLTIIPVRLKAQPTSEDVSKSILYFPIVGFIIGAFLYVFYIFFHKIIPEFLLDVCLLGIWIFLTGAIHLDGVGDVFDGFYAGKDKEEILWIMKDQHIGAMGVIGIGVFLIFKLACIHSLPMDIKSKALLFIPGIGRGAVLLPMYILPYDREEGTGKDFVKSKEKIRFIFATFIWLFFCLFFGMKGVGIIVINTTLLLLFILYLKKKINGITGDCLGFAIELIEIVSLFFLCVGTKDGMFISFTGYNIGSTIFHRISKGPSLEKVG